MKKLLLAVGAVASLLVIAGLVLFLVGRQLPERHRATISFVVPRPPAVVWGALTDYASLPKWWPAVRSVRFEKSASGETITWTRDPHGQEIGFRTKAAQPPEQLTREIVGDGLMFGGTWTYRLDGEGASTRITVTEDGFIRPPLFRAVARYFYGLDGTLKDFAAHFSPYVSGQ